MKDKNAQTCPASRLIKSLSGKWKAEIFRLASVAPLRFGNLLQQLPDANKQSITVALRDLEGEDLLQRIVIKEKPMHVEYHITEKGKSLLSIFNQLEQIGR